MRGGRDDGMGKLIYRMETAVDATGFKGIYDRLTEAYAELEALTTQSQIFRQYINPFETQ